MLQPCTITLQYCNTEMKKVSFDKSYRDLMLSVIVQAVHDYGVLERRGAIVDGEADRYFWKHRPDRFHVLNDYTGLRHVRSLVYFLRSKNLDKVLNMGTLSESTLDGNRLRRRLGLERID